MNTPIIAPSILSANFTELGRECEAVLEAGADWLHVDVMDGHYVPNLTIGVPVVRALRARLPSAFLDVHLMIDNPDECALDYVKAGASSVSFHPEVSRHPHRTIGLIRKAGAGAALAINPGTSLHFLDYLEDDLDMILLMSVNPGFGGQAFIEGTLHKLEQLRARLDKLGLNPRVEVDGGVSPDNIAKIHAAGADTFVAGSSIFNHPPYESSIARLRAQV